MNKLQVIGDDSLNWIDELTGVKLDIDTSFRVRGLEVGFADTLWVISKA